VGSDFAGKVVIAELFEGRCATKILFLPLYCPAVLLPKLCFLLLDLWLVRSGHVRNGTERVQFFGGASHELVMMCFQVDGTSELVQASHVKVGLKTVP
jgi:hypothetical protein